jgi:allantoate deiminase
MVSGYGHDAMILAEKIPSALIFIRTPDGFSQNPGMRMNAPDIELALASGVHFLREIHGFARKPNLSVYA